MSLTRTLRSSSDVDAVYEFFDKDTLVGFEVQRVGHEPMFVGPDGETPIEEPVGSASTRRRWFSRRR